MRKKLTERDMQVLKELERFRITEEEFNRNIARARCEDRISQQTAGVIENNRKARCVYCGRITTSAPSLPFFESRSDKEFDEWYDGCRGWD